MNIASKDLGDELFELSGWDGPYDLGYLLRKLPKTGHDNVFATSSIFNAALGWTATWESDNGYSYADGADTPEDAAAKLAIELFKQGVLTNGSR